MAALSLVSPLDSRAAITIDSMSITIDSTLITVDSAEVSTLSNVQYAGVQTTTSLNSGSFSAGYDQLDLVIGDVVVVSVTTDQAHPSAYIVHAAGYPSSTTVYNANLTTFRQPRLRVDVLVYDGTWPSTLNYRFSTSENETWIAYVTRWVGVDTDNPVAASAGRYDGVTSTPTSPALSAPVDNLTSIAIYGAREDDFDSNGTPPGFTTIGIGASNIGTSGSSSGIAYRNSIVSGGVPAAVWTQAAATHSQVVQLLLQGVGGSDDLDGDGLSNSLEQLIGTDISNTDTDGDGLDDFTEVAYDGDPSAFVPGQDTNPLSIDTDADGIADGIDPIPLDFNFADGDLAPTGAPDSLVNAADLLIAQRIVLGLLTPTSLELAHADLYPPGAPDGLINLQDLILLQQLLWQ